MSSSGVSIELQPRTAPCHASTVWYSESALLVCSLSYGTVTQAPVITAQRIDAALGISTTPPRALLGDVEFTWQDNRLHSLELRTRRSQWEASSLLTPSERVEEAAMTFELDYDVNDMMHVDERRVSAAGHAAAVSIAREHGATQRRPDALLGAQARLSVSSRGLRLRGAWLWRARR
jgi:hypothetical protein